MRFFRPFLVLFLVPAVLGAQFLNRSGAPGEPIVETQGVAPVVVDSGSPRASLLGYLNAARAGNFERAAYWMDQSYPEAAERSADLARRMKAVLDSRLWIDLDRISARAEGDTADGLPRDREQLGVITLKDDRVVPIRLARVGTGDDRRWVFSATTVGQTDELYSELPDNWIREHLPAPLLASGPFDILYWQWIALLVLIPLALFIGMTLGRPTRAVLRKIVSKTDTQFDDLLIASARGPITLIWAVVASRVLLRWIALPAPAHTFMIELQQALAIVAVFWLLLRAIGVLQDTMPSAKWTETHPALRSLIPLGGRIARLFVFAIGVLTVLSQFGYPIATILAGLGIGGIAIALGAQKSLEHFFGSVSIGVDQPFRVGDWVKVGTVAGSIESIGLRSTRIRTMDRTIVSMPNGSLAEAQSENFGERERIRLAGTIGVEYGTSAATVRILRDGIEKILRAHPLTWQDRVQVAFSNFGAYSLDIEFFCWLETTAIDDFRAARHDLFLEIMEFVESNGASFAFPTQTIHVARGEQLEGPSEGPNLRGPSSP
jgi:MscS family membrane protein